MARARCQLQLQLRGTFGGATAFGAGAGFFSGTDGFGSIGGFSRAIFEILARKSNVPPLATTPLFSGMRTVPVRLTVGRRTTPLRCTSEAPLSRTGAPDSVLVSSAASTLASNRTLFFSLAGFSTGLPSSAAPVLLDESATAGSAAAVLSGRREADSGLGTSGATALASAPSMTPDSGVGGSSATTGAAAGGAAAASAAA